MCLFVCVSVSLHSFKLLPQYAKKTAHKPLIPVIVGAGGWGCVSVSLHSFKLLPQYAKKTAHKPLIPVIVGAGGWDWQATVVGMLIAGERYIDLQKKELYADKYNDVKLQVCFQFYVGHCNVITVSVCKTLSVASKCFSIPTKLKVNMNRSAV